MPDKKSDISKMITSYIQHKNLNIFEYDVNQMDNKTHDLYQAIVAILSAEELIRYSAENHCSDNAMKAKVLLLKSLEDLERTAKNLGKIK